MKTSRNGMKWLIGTAAFAALCGTASARDNIAFSISIGAPAYAPPVVYMQAPPVRIAYAPVAYPAPQVVYYPEPYYGPGPRWEGREHGRGRGHGYGHYYREARHGWR